MVLLYSYVPALAEPTRISTSVHAVPFTRPWGGPGMHLEIKTVAFDAIGAPRVSYRLPARDELVGLMRSSEQMKTALAKAVEVPPDQLEATLMKFSAHEPLNVDFNDVRTMQLLASGLKE